VRPSLPALLILLIAALLLLLGWMTVTGRLGTSRHGYAAVAAAERRG
jgi:hypothetical protein